MINSTINSLKKLSWPVFLLLLAIASLMWLVNKLSYTYTAEVAIPIEFTSDYKSDVWVNSEPKNIRFLVEGEGSWLLLYKLGFGSKIALPVSAVGMKHITGDAKYLSTASEEALVKALATSQNQFNIIMMTDTLPKVIVSPIEKRKFALVGRVDIECAPQYMIVGDVEIVPDSIVIKAPRAVLDTLGAIYTSKKTVKDCNSSQSGAIDIIIPPFIVSELDIARYEAVVKRFTEKVYTLPIELPVDDANAFTLPRDVQIVVQIPLDGYFETAKPKAYIRSDDTHKYKQIYISGLPKSAKIVRQEPQFAQIYTKQ